MIVVFQLENELSSTATKSLLHNPSPSAWKDWIVLLASDSFRTTREQQQIR
jgi:hypothetical protein